MCNTHTRLEPDRSPIVCARTPGRGSVQNVRVWSQWKDAWLRATHRDLDIDDGGAVDRLERVNPQAGRPLERRD